MMSTIIFGQRNIQALKTSEKITLDARLDEDVWNEVEWKSHFTQLKPVPGNLSLIHI